MAEDEAQRSQQAVDDSQRREIAYQLYQNRQILGKSGDGQQDWETAKQILQSPVRRRLFKLHGRFIGIEKRVWEPILHWASNQAWLSLLGVAGNVGLIIAAASYVGSEKLRRDAEVFTAWQVITSADGQPGNGGRIKALEFLNASPGSNWRRKFPWFCTPLPLCTWPAESLDGLNLAAPKGGPGVYLSKVQLPKASLARANLQGADLERANLQGADLRGANLQGANLERANLQGAYLVEANLQDADLVEANFQGAYLRDANFQGAYLRGANFQDADLLGANFQGAYLRGANLQGADLSEANLQGTDLALSLDSEQLQGEKPPILCGTALPESLSKIKGNRDCDRLERYLIENEEYTPEQARYVIDELRNKQWEPLP